MGLFVILLVLFGLADPQAIKGDLPIEHGRQHPFKQACNEATNCTDDCNKIGEELQPRHCFKGACVLDTIIDCADTFESCKEGVPDDYCG